MQKTIIITGSSRGIGFELAHQFLNMGHNVVINGSTDESTSNAVAKLEKYKLQVLAISGDICETNIIDKLITETFEHFGQIDIWINNAGVSQPYHSTWELDSESITRTIKVNTIALIECTKRVYAHMRSQGFGKIFNMEGLGSDGRMTDKLSIYGTSKRAVNYFTKAFSIEAKKDARNIQIGVLSPGIVVTDFLRSSLQNASPEEIKQATKIFNILGDKPEVVTPILAQRVIKSNKNYDRIIYLNGRKAAWRFFKSLFVKRNIMN